MDITNNERMRLAASAYRAYIQHAAQMELPLEDDAIEDDILADLIAGLHHYADSRGTGFENAVASGQAAYERHRAEVRVVLTDMSMPIMDGPTTIRAILALDPDVRIIACSGLRSEPGAAQAKDLKVKAFLTKPYTASALLGTLQKVLAV